MTDVVVIAGANGGTSLSIATKLLEEGCHVAILDFGGENLIALEEKYPDRLIFCRCDVTSKTEVQAMIDTIVKWWGKIDILISKPALIPSIALKAS